MEPVVEWMILCDSAKQENGKLNIRGVHSSFKSRVYPASLDSLHVVFRVVGSPDETLPVRLELWQGDNKINETHEETSRLTETGDRVVILSTRELLIPDPGRYSIVLMSEGTLLSHGIYSFVLDEDAQ